MKNTFKIFKGIEKKNVLKIEDKIKLSKGLEDLIEATEEAINIFPSSEIIARIDEQIYHGCQKLLDGVVVSLNDIQEYCSILEHFRHTPFFPSIGLLVSAALNQTIEEDSFFELDIGPTCASIDRFCFGLEKGTVKLFGKTRDHLASHMSGGCIIMDGKTRDFAGKHMSGGYLEVIGYTGNFTGAYMSNGLIEVHGSAGNECSRFQRGGLIHINGNAGAKAGFCMEYGELTIVGDTGMQLGELMDGGKINLFGDYKTLSKNIDSGKIYHKTKCIVDK